MATILADIMYIWNSKTEENATESWPNSPWIFKNDQENSSRLVSLLWNHVQVNQNSSSFSNLFICFFFNLNLLGTMNRPLDTSCKGRLWTKLWFELFCPFQLKKPSKIYDPINEIAYSFVISLKINSQTSYFSLLPSCKSTSICFK